jgi:hypothetical protein
VAATPNPPAPSTSEPHEPPPDLSFEQLVSPLLGKTFELRREYEAKLRLLTDLQHEIDVIRMSGTPFPRRRQGMDNLALHFRELAKATSDAEALLKAVRAEFDRIHLEVHDIEKHQRQL